jgi:hypothetical protein
MTFAEAVGGMGAAMHDDIDDGREELRREKALGRF